MSFLVCPGDPETLAEALAFVDGFDFSSGDSNNTDEASGSSDVDADKRARSDDSAEAAPLDTLDKSRNRRKNAIYSARLRAKKKNEMQQLKEQVTQLQMQLERLKSAKAATTTTGNNEYSRLLTSEADGTGLSHWLQEATAQAYRRQQSEQLNAQLKTLLNKVVKRSKTMHDAFQNLQSLGCEINTAVGAPSTILAGPSLRSNDATPQLGELRDRLDQMYATAGDVFATSGAGTSEAASFVSQIKRDPVSGRKFVQLSSWTPLTSDLDTASRLIWQGMQLKSTKCGKYHVHRLHVNASSIAKSFFLTLSDDPTPCTLHGAAFVRKFEERDRILYIWATAMVPPRTKSGIASWQLRVREKGWIMLSRASHNPEQESVFHTCYEVSSELGRMGIDAGDTSTKGDYDRIGHGVVNLLSSDLRKFHERIQGKLLSGTSMPLTATC